MLVLALLLALSLSACGNQPGTATPPTGSGGENDSASPTPASHDTTYWTAVRYESYNPSFGRTEVSAMPTEKWWADLYLNEDGTALFWEALGFGYASYLINAEWWLGADNALRLTGEDLDESFISMDGRKEKDSSVMLETPYGNRFYFEPTERPVSGGELCMADLKGTWRMSAGEAEGDEFSPEEMHMASLLNIERWWSDDEGGYTLRADYYSAHLLDTDAPEYKTEEDLLTEKLGEPLMYGLPNELWSARLYAAIDRKMRAKVHQGNGATLHETGATIRVRCSKEKFESLKPATKRAKADFRQLCGYLEEKLAYTYAAILAEGRITIGVICREQNAPESYHQLEALEPLWEEDPVELPETTKNVFVEGDGGEHPPPPDREGLHGFGRATVSEPRVSSVRVSLAGRTDAAEHR